MSRPNLAQAWAQSKNAESILPILDQIKAMIQRDGHAPGKDVVTAIDRRLRLCKNPEKIVGSKAYNAKKQREEAEAEAKRMKKAETIRKAMDENDPFGDPIEGGEAAANLAQLDDDD